MCKCAYVPQTWVIKPLLEETKMINVVFEADFHLLTDNKLFWVTKFFFFFTALKKNILFKTLTIALNFITKIFIYPFFFFCFHLTPFFFS